MSLNALQDIYNPPAKNDEPQDVVVSRAGHDTTSCDCPIANSSDRPGFVPPQLNSWQDSAPVMLLSEYLRMNKDPGCRICLDKGDPALSFDPAIRREDTHRWKIAQNIVYLFFNAVDDIRHLVDHGMLELSEMRRD